MAVMTVEVEGHPAETVQKSLTPRAVEPQCTVVQTGDEIVYKGKPLPEITHTNLASFILEAACVKYADETALLDGATGTRHSYDQIRNWVTRAAAGLVSLGLKPKDVVLVLCPNLPEFPVVYLAVVALGAIVAPTNPLNTEADVVKQVKQSNAKFIVTVPQQMSKVQTCNLPLILIGDESDRSKSTNTAPITLFSDLSSPTNNSDASIPYADTQADDTCTLLFSSGTTGMSKAVELTHMNFMSAVAAYNTLDPGASTFQNDVCLAIIPMYHVYGLGIVMLATLERGASVVTMPRFSLQGMLQYVEKYRITIATLVPPIIVMLVKNEEVANYDLSSLRIIATGAASLREDTMEACAKMFPQCIMRQGYGMTEAPLISFSVLANERLQWGSVGVLVPGTETRVTDVETGKSMPPNASGEIWIRAPTVMTGYLNNPEVTAATRDEQGWLHTGDLGYVDSYGYLFIVDRLKEIIKYKAHQVAPGELEAIMLTNPDILDVAVIPVPDEEAGELPCAYVVRRTEELTEKQVMDYVGKQVAPYKKVRLAVFTDKIPKSPAGKILRKEIIAQYKATHLTNGV